MPALLINHAIRIHITTLNETLVKFLCGVILIHQILFVLQRKDTTWPSFADQKSGTIVGDINLFEFSMFILIHRTSNFEVFRLYL